MENRLNAGITHGDVNGVSYELIIKLLAENRMCDLCTPILYGSSKVAAYYKKAFNAETFNLNGVKDPSEANGKRSNIVNCVDDEVKVEIGKETEDSDKAAMKALKCALDHLDNQMLDILTLAPQGVNSFATEGADCFIDFLAKRYNTLDLMTIAVNERLKIGFVAENVKFRDVPRFVTAKNVYRKLTLLDNSLRMDFTIQRPKIAVLALNPSVKGMGQDEEKNVLEPVIERARQNGIMAIGPFGAEEFFAEKLYEKFDAVLAMYYDQGIVPFKAMDVEGNAAYIAGLPVVCTTSLEEPKYNIAGQNVADEQGLRDAMYLGMDIFVHRVQNLELRKNPLPHYDIASNSNESDLNVEQIEGVKEEIED